MVYLELKRFSTWHFGHKIGALAVVFLVLAPFLPYWGREYLNGRTDFVIYADFHTFGLLFLIPLFSALLIFFLLFLNLNIYIDGNPGHKKINYHVLMVWGIIFFLIYIMDAMRTNYYSTVTYSQFAGIGLWFMVTGFLFCTLAGIIQWRNPEFVGPQILKGTRTKKATVSADSDAPAVQTVHIMDDESSPYPWEKSNTSENNLKKGKFTSSQKNTNKTVNMTNTKRKKQKNEREILLRWLEHSSGNGRTFEQCLRCNNYGFINTKDTGDSITFQCTDCGEKFLLEK